jgi:hypothetical protein
MESSTWSWRQARTGLVPLLALLALLAAIYTPGIGHGFIKDDVVWVEANDVSSWQDLKELAFRTHGFYRPLVSASFAADRAIYGLWPLGYGITNFGLLVLSTLAVAWVATGLGLNRSAAIAVAAIWSLNFHGINMAVLWLSGRTALWLVLCSLLAAGLLVRRRPLLAGVAVLFAAFAKEEAVMLPVIFTAWALILRFRQVREVRQVRQEADAAGERHAAAPGLSRVRERMLEAIRATWPSWLAVAAYLLLRSRTNAMTPATSPWFYSFTFAPTDLAQNVLEYLDRAGTFSVIVLVVACVAAGRLPQVSARTRRLAVMGAVWFAGAYALTVFLPVRSSLYACLPSVGAALVAGSLLQDLWSAMNPARHRRLIITAAVMTILLLPIYWDRNTRWVEIADLSRDTFALLDTTVTRGPGAGMDAPSIIFEDDRATRRSFANTYGVLLPVAVKLATGRDMPVMIEPPLPDNPESGHSTAPDRTRTTGDTAAVRIRLRNGHVSRVNAEPK